MLDAPDQHHGVSETVVVCRPEQFREAAVVLSCLPTDRFTPLIVVTSPPKSLEDHLRNVADLHAAQEELYELDPWKQEHSAPFYALRKRLGAARAEIAGMRAWFKRNLMLNGTLHKLGCSRAVLLFEAVPEDLLTFDPALDTGRESAAGSGAGQDEQEDRIEPLLWGLESVYLLPGQPDNDLGSRRYYRDLPSLPEAVWRLLRDQAPMPEQTVRVPCGADAKAYVAGLFDALRTGRPLSPAWQMRPLVDPLQDGDATCGQDEAVLIDNACDALALYAASYAHLRAARLVITLCPDTDLVDQTIRRDKEVLSRAAAAADKHGDGPEPPQAEEAGETTRGWVSTNVSNLVNRQMLARIERAVTSQVPEEALRAVGERRLTAFTAGVPYTFVNAPGHDWSSKPIGHVIADPDLIVLRELVHLADPASGGALTAVFDPHVLGPDGGQPAAEVPRVRDAASRFTHTVVFSGEDATLRILMDAVVALPLEFVFFATHGEEGAIRLHEGWLQTHYIDNWVYFACRPVVLNNSCRSLTGVGRSFVRAGARGYIGTLWDVPDQGAADFARIVTQRVASTGLPPAEAILGTRLPHITSRAYVYIGTVNGRVDNTTLPPDAAVQAYKALLSAMAGLLQWASRHGSSQGRLPDILYGETGRLRRTVRASLAAPTADLTDLMLDQLQLLSRSDLALRCLEKDPGLIDETLSDLHTIDLPDLDRQHRLERHRDAVATLRERRSETQATLDAYQQPRPQAASDAPALLRIAQALTHQGSWDLALDNIRQALVGFTSAGNESGRLACLGLQCQILRRLRRFEEALDAASAGTELADRLADVAEKASFLVDVSQIRLELGDLDKALEVAEQALVLSRSASTPRGTLAALGHLVGLHLHRGDMTQAHVMAQQGLRDAADLGERSSAAAFKLDLARICELTGDWQGAVEWTNKALIDFHELRNWEKAAAALARLVLVASRAGHADALLVCCALSVGLCTRVGSNLLQGTVEAAIVAMARVVELLPPATARQALTEVIILITRTGEKEPQARRALGLPLNTALTLLNRIDRENPQG
ncbi:CHAT domain-containing protein [Streptomyces morookaense]|uniref:CHAT domain-containing protein n=1 Tax=Streptomyces morookaense TaxID=1970 RepID=A0A7Y7B5I5_STRMO|nr:CHAT domain-containing protein [Streptomyces morookaense]NVK79393.1 CHAT domain-containing protein [Streptomyces morookaense]